jgi:hypothetical protein
LGALVALEPVSLQLLLGEGAEFGSHLPLNQGQGTSRSLSW